MTQLSELESKIGEVMGLAMAAQDSTKKVEKLLDGEQQLVERLQRMRSEAQETQKRCEAVAAGMEGKKTAIKEQARETKKEAAEMMQAYLGGKDEALDGFEWLIMAEAGELGHWEIVRTMSEVTHAYQVRELADWAIPIQQRHLTEVREGSLELARQEA